MFKHQFTFEKMICYMKKVLIVFIFLVGVFAHTSQAQTKKITGKVFDEKGLPILGASVIVKNTKIFTLTNDKGVFNIEMPNGTNAIVVSFVGMETTTLNVATKTSVNVTLISTATALADVVVIGYGTVKKSDLTGSAQRISREDIMRDNPGNILQAMQGKLAGVNVTQNDGAPGAGLSIRVRGSNSFLGGTEPLYVIDGVPFNNSSSGSTPESLGSDEKQTLNALAFINPNDIESIDVLKDASATAIYGSRGANGVVLITTRKGKIGKDKVELNSTVGLAEVSKKLRMLNPMEYAEFQNLSYANSNKYDGTAYNPPYLNTSDYATDNNNWQEKIFKKALTQQYSLNISGASEAGSHNLTFGYVNQEGVIQTSGFKKISVSFNLNRNLGKIFKIGTSTSLSNSTTNGVKTGTDKSDAASAGVVRSALTFPATTRIIEEYDGLGDDFITNPYIYVNDVLNKVSSTNIFMSNYVEAALHKNLKFRQNVGFNYGSNNRDQYYPRTIYEGFASKGWGLKSESGWSSLVSESILTFNKKLEKHSITLTGASTFEQNVGQSVRAEAKTFPNDLLKNENLQLAEQILPIITNKYQSNLISFLGRANYAFNDKYLISLSHRNDGSSKFGKNNKWSSFSSGGFAWKLHKEAFFSALPAISEFTLRVSYGQTGNQGIGSYASLSKLAIYNYPFNGAIQTGLADDVFSGPANPALKWETTNAYNAGLDLGLFKGRLNMHVDAYIKRTNDLLQFITTPASTGFQRQLRNSGSVENKGIELALDALVIKGKDFQWKSNFNISFNRNKIISLGGDIKEQFASNISTRDAPFIQRAGLPIGTIYGYVEDGYYDNEAEVRKSLEFSAQPYSIIRRMIGEVKYKNLDNDPTSISVSDRTVIGDVNPDYTFGFTNNFKYKNLDMSIFINGVQGNDIINMNSVWNGNIGTSKNITLANYEGAWKEGADNSNAAAPKPIRQFWRTLPFTRRFIEDGSFVRIKNVNIGYTLPTSLVKGINSIRISLGANNLYTFTNYSGYDPEINSYGDNPALFGVDLGGFPNSKTYNVTIKCNF
jgi:TonB-linked SusC/RagA family outer membrane protein